MKNLSLPTGNNDPTLVAPAPAPEKRRPSDPYAGFITKPEVGQNCRKSVRWVDGAMKRGLIPFVKLPGKRGAVLFRWADVEAALTRFTVK